MKLSGEQRTRLKSTSQDLSEACGTLDSFPYAGLRHIDSYKTFPMLCHGSSSYDEDRLAPRATLALAV
jgi:hypothetical protein